MNIWRRAVAGALALGGLLVTQAVASAEPLRAPELVQVQPIKAVSDGNVAADCNLRRYGHPPYGYYGYRRHFYGYRRPFYGYRRPFYGYGYRRPFYGYGFYRPFRRFYY